MNSLKEAIARAANPEKALVMQRFFKTGKGQYGEGDVFLGLTVPQQREIAKKFTHLSLEDIQSQLKSKIHEERLIALLILVDKYNKEVKNRKEIFDFYLSSTQYINNWDLVDTSADKIIGRSLFDFGKDYPVYKVLLRKLAESSNLWERRIAIVSTFYFIKQKQFDETLHITEILMKDKHDLIHKACGWMLREVGKRDVRVLEQFLKKHAKQMPRTMLRYAIEKFDEKTRKEYMKK